MSVSLWVPQYRCIGNTRPNLHFLDALASFKTMFEIHSVPNVFKILSLSGLQSVTECYRVLQSITEN